MSLTSYHWYWALRYNWLLVLALSLNVWPIFYHLTVLPKFEVTVTLPSFALTTDTTISGTVKAKYVKWNINWYIWSISPLFFKRKPVNDNYSSVWNHFDSIKLHYHDFISLHFFKRNPNTTDDFLRTILMHSNDIPVNLCSLFSLIESHSLEILASK